MAKILIIDDKQSILDFISVCLEDDHEVVTSSDAQAAILMARQTHFDVVITDIYMPGKDGLEVIQDIARISPKSKIIAITGESSASPTNFLKAASAMGADVTLQKPFLIDQIQGAVSKVFCES
jgi:DNA-binding NtrC family response regulator